jgi:hypothetical protein
MAKENAAINQFLRFTHDLRVTKPTLEVCDCSEDDLAKWLFTQSLHTITPTDRRTIRQPFCLNFTTQIRVGRTAE